MPSFFAGKTILTGEHSVVYGYPAILVGLELGISVTIKSGHLTVTQQKDQYLQRILLLFANFFSISIEKLRTEISLQVESSLPVKSGLGSSAAFAAAVLSELAKFYSCDLNKTQLYTLVLEAENFVHGHSSGADPSIVVYGGLLAFKKGEFKQIQTSTLKNQNFFLIDSGEAIESTGEMVALVAANPYREKILQQISFLSQEMLGDLEKNRFNPKLLDQNNEFLNQLGVIGKLANKKMQKLRKLNAFCKVTGAGGIKAGSGYILAFHQNPIEFEKNLKTTGFSFFKTQLGAK